MSAKLVIDVCLSPQWVELLSANGYDAVHWTHVGDPMHRIETSS